MFEPEIGSFWRARSPIAFHGYCVAAVTRDVTLIARDGSLYQGTIVEIVNVTQPTFGVLQSPAAFVPLPDFLIAFTEGARA